MRLARLRQSGSEGEPDGRTARLVEALREASGGEALRGLAASVLQDHVGRGRRGLAVCGAAARAGVTMTTAALGVALARLGVKVLLVEANLRHSTLGDLLPPSEASRPGLLQFLTGEALEPATLIDPAWANLSVIHAGGAAPNAQDLFDSDRFEDLMRYALRTYDLTLVDTPPANRCAETRRIAAVTGYAAVVARRDLTMADDVKTLISDLRTSRVEVIGAIFNEG